jgi:hypothetical protein
LTAVLALVVSTTGDEPVTVTVSPIATFVVGSEDRLTNPPRRFRGRRPEALQFDLDG